MKIAVMVKIVPKPEEVTLDEESMTINREDADSQLNPADKNAVEMALELKDQNEDTEVIAFSMGPPFFEEFLQDVVAMGVDDAVLLSDRAFAGADTYPTSRVLAAGVEKLEDVDLVLCGEESADSSTGQVPPGIAQWLDYNQVTYVNKAVIKDGTLVATRTVSGGEETVEVPLPVVGSVEFGVNDPRFPDFKRKRWADSEWELTVWDHEDLGLSEDELGLEGSYTGVEGFEEISGPERQREWIEGGLDEKVQDTREIILNKLN